MHQLVRSAIEAAKLGQKNKAVQFLKQALTANPNDTEAMLVLAGLLDQPDRKRQILNRILALEPLNKLAREEMLKLDRMTMRTFHSIASVSTDLERPTVPSSRTGSSRKSEPRPPGPAAGIAVPQPPVQNLSASKPLITQPVDVKNSFTRWDWVEESPTVKPQVAIELDRSLIIEKPLVFKFPLFWRILLYCSIAFFGFVGLLQIVSQNLVNSLPFVVLAALIGLIALVFSPAVEVSEAGIRAYGMFSSAEIRWDEITTLRSSPLRGRLQLSSKTGTVVNVSTQVSGYPRLVELIRQRRPDLFGGDLSNRAPGTASAVRYGELSSVPSFTGTKTFRKNFLAQYALSFLLIPVCLLLVWSLFVEPQYRIWAILFGGFCVVMMVLPFFQPGIIKLEPNKLTTESFFNQREFAAKHIRDISLKTVRSRRGVATNFVNIQPVEGSAIALAGFQEGDEILYGTLLNWWESYRDE
jgi:hypothetical protein